MKQTRTDVRLRHILALLVVVAVSACAPGLALDQSNGDAQAAARTGQATILPALYQPTAAAMVGAAVSQGQAESLEDTLIGLYRQANPAVVYIVVGASSGSGFLYSREGYIVTNRHVVAAGQSYEVIFSNGDRQRATLVGADADADLAVLEVKQVPAGVEPLQLAYDAQAASEEQVQVGQLVVAIGNPFGEQGSMSLGIVSGLNRSLRSQRDTAAGSSYSLPQVIQTDAPINPGNSGGPLLNLKGEVVGVNAAIASTTGANTGVGFAIPVAAVRQIVPVLIEEGAYVYPYMGASFDDEISLSDQSTYGVPQTQGAYVVSTTPGGPAARAGLVAADPQTGRGGDLIVEIDGRPIGDFSDLNGYLVFHTSPGQTIQISVLRGGQRITVPLELGARP